MIHLSVYWDISSKSQMGEKKLEINQYSCTLEQENKWKHILQKTNL